MKLHEAAQQAPAIAENYAVRVQDRGWRLELSKGVLREGFTFSLRVEKANNGPRRRFFRASTSRQLPLQLLWGSVLLLRFTLSALAAWVGLLACGRYLRFLGTRPANSELIVATHLEDSNRTRHLLRLCDTPHPAKVCMILGRPKIGWKKLIHHPVLEKFGFSAAVYPVDKVALIGSVIGQLRELGRGLREMLTSGYFLPWRDEVAVLFRAFLGQAYLAWWERNRAPAVNMLVAHTGTLDVHGLEAAIQANGGKTAHVVHGVCEGLGFSAFSNVGLFQCSFDAALNRKYGTYGDTVFGEPLPRPLWHRGGSGVLLATNYVHPTNRFAGRDALELEAEMLRIVNEEVGTTHPVMTYRPHPAFWSLPARQTDALLAMAQDSGFEISGPDAPPLDFSQFAIVVCSPSTLALDALRVGVLPIILALHSISPDVVYSRFSTLAHARDDFRRALSLLSDPKRGDLEYRRTFDAVGLGRPIGSLTELARTCFG